MESAVVFILFLAAVTFTDLARSQTIYASQNPVPVGSNVTLSSNSTVTSGGWLFNTRQILIKLNTFVAISKSWETRVIFNVNTSSLTIKSVKLEDSGNYTLEDIFTNFFSQLTLSVQEPVSNVTIQTSTTNLVEFNDKAVLVCSVSKGTHLSYQWLNGSSVISANEKVQLSNGSTILTIMNVTRYDQGPYRCNVYNSVSNNISSPVNLIINYGPSNTEMTVLPLRNIYKGGSNITLSCSAVSNPPAMFQWMVNGVYLNETEQSLQLQQVNESMSGNYTCLIYNNVTSRFSSKTATIQIVDPVTAVAVNLNKPAIFGEMFSLSCEVTGPVDIICWWRNGQLISADNRTTFSTGNKTLTISSTQHSDGGNYQCKAFNSVSNLISNHFRVIVYYGPETPFIHGPAFAETGRQAIFQCSAKSVPPSMFCWWFNGSIVANTSQYKTEILSLNMSGEYKCMAINNVTGNNSTNSTTLTVIEAIESVMIQTNTIPINNQNFTLSCKVNGPYDTIYWMKDNMKLNINSSNGTQMSYNTENNMVHFTPVTMYNDGIYQCVATNKASQHVSFQYSLLVNYPIQNVKVNAPVISVIEGDSYNLTCNVTGPADYIYWMKNGHRLHEDNRILFCMENKTVEINPVERNDTGNYYCLAVNAAGNVRSPPHMLVVIYPIENVEIKAPMMPAIEGNSYYLACNVTGPAEYIYWMKNGAKLHEDNRTVFYMENKTLHLSKVARYDNGNYCCVANNAFGSKNSTLYNFIVNYGPETPIIRGPAVVQTGRQAVLNCSAMSFPPSMFYWWFNGSIVANTSQYTTGLLSPNMSTEYTCMAINNVTGKNSTNSMRLTVIDPIQKVEVKAPMMPAKEGYSYNLTCSVTGPADYIYWMKNGKKLLENNRTVFFMSNKTVYFSMVERYDTGNYCCMAINAVGNMTSPDYNLIINYGPEKPIIYGPAFAETGRQAIFNCSAKSVPLSQFCWWFSGSIVSNRSEYITSLLSSNMSGEYTCMAINNVTGKNSTNSTTLTVIEAIQSVMIKNKTIPIDTKNFTLTCEVVGPYDTIYWMKDNMKLTSNNSYTSYKIENNTLNLTPVTLNSGGMYQCVATNKAGDHVSPQYSLLVNYGPLRVTISRASMFMYVALTCKADSWPDCDYWWFFNNQSTPLQSTSVIVFPANSQNFGNYTCKAWNRVTNITLYQNLTVTAHAPAIHFQYQGSLMMMVLFAFSAPVLFN